ncbi:MAG: protein phosphatase 2C domain-containing protein [Oligoflexia bacterium]|nr:protein phosphatase 2C domain-containing protein [Oligoflexia bacterium]
MPITRIDCSFLCPQERADYATCVMLNPSAEPGSLVFAGSVAARESIGAQVACKLALEHFVEGVLDFFTRRRVEQGALSLEALSTAVLENAFKSANTSVYAFGHRLAAAGRMAASLLGLVVQDTTVAAGRVGPGAVYLFRDGELFPFFEERQFSNRDIESERLIGAHSIVSVELSSISIAPRDVLFAISEPLSKDQELQLAVLLAELQSLESTAATVEDYSRRVSKRLFGVERSFDFQLLALAGPEAVLLTQRI